MAAFLYESLDSQNGRFQNRPQGFSSLECMLMFARMISSRRIRGSLSFLGGICDLWTIDVDEVTVADGRSSLEAEGSRRGSSDGALLVLNPEAK